MRRGMRHSHFLGTKKPIFFNIFKTLMNEMSGNYPELKRAESLKTQLFLTLDNYLTFRSLMF